MKRLPDTPGVYRMLGEADELLYVGKARSLKKRVVQYAQGRAHSASGCSTWWSLTRAMEFVTTRTEADALLLESNLIKRLKPRFNIVLRDDKSFAEILLRQDHPAPQVRKHRGAPRHPGRLLRPLRLHLGGEPHAEHAAEGLPAALLLRQRLRQPHAALHAAPDQALLGPLHRPDRALEGYGDLVSGEAHDFLRGKSTRRPQPRLVAEMTPPPRRWSSSAPPGCATASARWRA